MDSPHLRVSDLRQWIALGVCALALVTAVVVGILASPSHEDAFCGTVGHGKCVQTAP